MKKTVLLSAILLSSLCATAQSGKNFIKPIDGTGFTVDSILSLRGNPIVYLRAGTEFDIEKRKVAYINHAILGRIDITGQPDSIAKAELAIPEPEFNGEAYMCNFDNNNYVKLEKVIGQIKTKDQLLGPEKKIYIKPRYSPLRAKIGEQKIIIRVPNQNEDPNAVIKVSKFSVGRTRKLTLSRLNEITGVITFGGYDYQEIPFKAEKYGASSFLISLDIKEAGEYGISINTPNNIGRRLTFACFGV